MADPTLTQIQDDVTEILRALKGNGLGVSQGLIARVENNRISIKRLVRIVDRTRWMFAGVGLGAGFVGGGLGAAAARFFGS